MKIKIKTTLLMALNKTKQLVIVLTLIVFSGCSSNSSLIQQATLSDSTAQIALDVSKTKIDSLYILGGRGPDKFDCSGLIVWAYRVAYPNLKLRINNIVVNDCNIDELWKFNIDLIPFDEAKPGNIVFLSDLNNNIVHGGLFIKWIDNSNIEFINASSYFGKVLIDTWPVSETKRDQKIIGIGKLKAVIN